MPQSRICKWASLHNTPIRRTTTQKFRTVSGSRMRRVTPDVWKNVMLSNKYFFPDCFSLFSVKHTILLSYHQPWQYKLNNRSLKYWSLVCHVCIWNATPLTISRIVVLRIDTNALHKFSLSNSFTRSYLLDKKRSDWLMGHQHLECPLGREEKGTEGSGREGRAVSTITEDW